jgi:hypothetical protein
MPPLFEAGFSRQSGLLPVESPTRTLSVWGNIPGGGDPEGAPNPAEALCGLI